jgi:hypothetical protein
MAEEEEKMSEVTKVIFAFVGVMIIGFILVGTSGLTEQQKQDNAGMMHLSNLSRMSTIKCPKAIKKLTGAIIYQIADTVTDKQTYFTVKYGKTDKFESASCTVNQMGVLSELIVDGETLISK